MLKTARILLGAATFVFVACELDDRTIAPDDLGAIRIVDADPARAGVEYRSNRDAGYSVTVDSDEQVPALRRQLFIFGDTGASRVTTDPATGLPVDTPLGGFFPTNTASIVAVTHRADGTPELPPLPAAVFWFFNEPRRFLQFISGGEAFPAGEDCVANPGEHAYRAEWPKGVVQLPDNDPERDTVAVFYMNLCVRIGPHGAFAYDIRDGGVASYTWERSRPDDAPKAQVMNDQLFPPGQIRNRFSNQVLPGHPYGIGPVLFSEDGAVIHLYANQCAFNGDCTLARVPVSASVPGATNMAAVADASQWQYLTDGGAWHAFPMDGTRVSCVPTPDDDCSGFPRAQAVVKTDGTNIETLANAAPSFRSFGHELRLGGAPVATTDTGRFMIYAPPWIKDHAAARFNVSGSPAGDWSDPIWVNYPAASCAGGCRAPIFQPALDDGDNLAFSYYSDQGRLQLARVCWPRYLDLDASCD